jgi:hypothetical protein
MFCSGFEVYPKQDTGCGSLKTYSTIGCTNQIHNASPHVVFSINLSIHLFMYREFYDDGNKSCFRKARGATFNNHISKLENFQPQEYNHHHYDQSSITGKTKRGKYREENSPVKKKTHSKCYSTLCK